MLYKELKNVIKRHGNIIVGVDFDDTVFPLTQSLKVIERCDKVVHQLTKLKENYNITLCLYTVADPQSVKYKVHIMQMYGIKPDYVNESPIKFEGATKSYFNILLDDKAGLDETLKVITKLNKLCKKEKQQKNP